MLLTFRRFAFASFIFLNAFFATHVFAAPISVNYVSGYGYTNSQGTPTLFSMVPNSTQQLKFNITSTTTDTRIISCSISTSPLDTVSNLGGCTNVNGAGTPYPLVFTITAGGTAGSVSHTLTIKTVGGRYA